MEVLQTDRKQAKAESDSAFERLRAAMAEHNTKIAEQSKDMVKFISTMAVGIVVVLGGFIAVLRFFT